MEKLIHQYLDENYFPYKEKDVYNIYHNDNIIDRLHIESAISLVKKFKNIYCLEYEETKLFVYTWAIKIAPDVDLTSYWSEGYDKLSKYWGHGINVEDNTIIGGNLSQAEGNGVTDFANVTFPTFQRAIARTIGLDMVSVQPMRTPKGNLFYMDYQHNKPKKKTIKQKLNSILDKIKIFIRKMEKDIRKYLHITNYNITFVTQ